MKSTFLRLIKSFSVPVNWFSPCGTDECADQSDLILLKTRLGHAAVLGPSSGNPVGTLCDVKSRNTAFIHTKADD